MKNKIIKYCQNKHNKILTNGKSKYKMIEFFNVIILHVTFFLPLYLKSKI